VTRGSTLSRPIRLITPTRTPKLSDLGNGVADAGTGDALHALAIVVIVVGSIFVVKRILCFGKTF
jgi:hypothetical protein